ncbi:hypothetical protein ACFL2D_03285 [Patescibacteria group bacterium]
MKKQTAAEKGNLFTRYTLTVIVAIVVVAAIIFLAGDFVYSQIRPASPTVSYPLDGTTVGNNPPTFEGDLPLSAAIKVFIDDKEVATRKPEGQTVWSYTPEYQLEVGTHTIYVLAVGEEGFKSQPSKTISFNVPQKPQLTSFYDGQAFDASQPIFQGEAAPNVEVNLYLDGQFIMSTQSDTSGRFAFDSVESIPSGQHEAYVNAVKTIGEFDNDSESLKFVIQSSAPTTPGTYEQQTAPLPSNNTY